MVVFISFYFQLLKSVIPMLNASNVRKRWVLHNLTSKKMYSSFSLLINLEKKKKSLLKYVYELFGSTQ